MRRWGGKRLWVLALGILAGCHVPPEVASPAPGVPPGPLLPNPLLLPSDQIEWLWPQIVDAVDDYFHIQVEVPVRRLGASWTEGRIETYPQVGSTWLEPWRRDSTRGWERLHATLQTVRRRAVVRVLPAPQGYHVEVVVTKELEEVDRPEFSALGTPALRHDGSLTRHPAGRADTALTLGWIPLGRDVALEQQILRGIQGRVFTGLPAARQPALSAARK